ncbi:unnamed protein product [Hydatigera taeniaeformis]|uniref:Brix domain-containing protein n=1 Tax=Hydatigena taeniaeformis TaxID=6205 RepID=A0A3P7FGZ3_HYDTA|nr:unnamed protein product [Hydatigera taeniaeformis]
MNFVQRYFHNAERLQPCLIVYCRDRTAKSRYHTTSGENDDLAQEFLRNDPWRYGRLYIHEYPRLNAETKQPTLRRSKRNTVQFTRTHSAIVMKNRPPRRYCRRRKMVVSFEQLNMTDWILAPVTFDAGVCSGVCTFPLGQETQPTNHAVLQSVWSRFLRTSTVTSPDSSSASAQHVPPPCCVPHELEALPMLYFQTDNQVVLNHRPDMLKRQARLRREFIYRRSIEARDEARKQKRQLVKASLAEGKKLPKEIADEALAVNEDLDWSDDGGEGDLAAEDDEYYWAGAEDPRVVVTTSRSPSSKLQEFSKELRHLIPNATKINRGNYLEKDLMDACMARQFLSLVRRSTLAMP